MLGRSVGESLGVYLTPLPSNNNPLPPQINYAAALTNRETTKKSKFVRLEPRPFEIVDGKAKVVFLTTEDKLLVEKCKLTLVGKFSRTRPQIDKLREDFKRSYPLKGTFKIGAYDWRHIFIDFTDEDDFKRFDGKNTLHLCGAHMRLQRWTRKFKVAMESTLAPVWVTLPDLPWHYHDWAAIERILEPIGPLIALDKATIARTRPTTAKARVEIDLSRPRLNEIEVALVDDTGELDTFNQIIEYENAPEFCFFCKVQGHSDGYYGFATSKEGPSHEGARRKKQDSGEGANE
ncbi:uncharacterized protein LOC132038442 [Lycium ferocissimum]|uniref:uncharacterized protein LOC132038442 n=1 Tax=Lycium ferocissimum TaxID=112874 RepID=UPI0028164906|nr:uncharacterized protein LOC132038442 [Lycium ferocissimum]